MAIGPLFIIGTERSGSNLLRLILNAHSRVAIPHPPHIMRYFKPLEPGYGDLREEARFVELVDDVLALIDAHIFPWDYQLDRAKILVNAPQRSALGVMAAVYDQVRQQEGKARWGCKSTFMVDYADEVLDLYPGAQLILLVRDPRDVAVSSRDSVFSPCHPVLTARLWARQQRQGLDLLARLPTRTVHLLRYEDLLADPEGQIRAVCAFLGEEFEPPMLRFFEGRDAKKGASLSRSWENTGRPIITGNTGKYVGKLSPARLLAVEATCREPMAALGYAPVNPQAALDAWSLSVKDELEIKALEAAMRAQVELRSLREDSNHWRRWRRDATVEWIRARRRWKR